MSMGEFMNEQMLAEFGRLKPETQEQMKITNATWIRLTKLERRCALLDFEREQVRKEISVAKEDHTIQQGKLSCLLLEENFE